MYEADLRDCNFYNANLVRACLANARLDWAAFQPSDLTGADLSRATLRKTHLRESQSLDNLRGVDALGAAFGRAKLEGAILQDGNFLGTEFGAANLAGVKAAEPTSRLLI